MAHVSGTAGWPDDRSAGNGKAGRELAAALAELRRERRGPPGDLRGRRHLRPGRRRRGNAGRHPQVSATSHELKADVVKVGCIGLCSDGAAGGRAAARAHPRVLQAASPQDKVAGAAGRHAGRRQVPEELVLGQHRDELWSPGRTCPTSTSIPFFAPQTRWVLANCGMIDPSQIDEYIARGGYQALARMPHAT